MNIYLILLIWKLFELGEDERMYQWPKLYFSDMWRFYAKHLSRKNLLYRLECDYKEGKEYRYFTNKLLRKFILITSVKAQNIVLFVHDVYPCKEYTVSYIRYGLLSKKMINIVLMDILLYHNIIYFFSFFLAQLAKHQPLFTMIWPK